MTWSVATILVDAIVTPTRTYAERIEAGVVGKQSISASTDWVDHDAGLAVRVPTRLGAQRRQHRARCARCCPQGRRFDRMGGPAGCDRSPSATWASLLSPGRQHVAAAGDGGVRRCRPNQHGRGDASPVGRHGAERGLDRCAAHRLCGEADGFPVARRSQVLEKDIATFAQHGNVIEVGALYAQVGAQTRLMFDAQIALDRQRAQDGARARHRVRA